MGASPFREITASLLLSSCSEMFGMWVVIVIALGGVANHVLNPTTGKGMGYGFIAVGFAAAFAFPIIAFGSVSAMLNPAAALSLVASGLLGPGQFFTVCAGEMVGAILGAITVWIIYLPQIQRAGQKVFKFSDLKKNKKVRKEACAAVGIHTSLLFVKRDHCTALAVVCDGLRCKAYGTSCYGIL